MIENDAPSKSANRGSGRAVTKMRFLSLTQQTISEGKRSPNQLSDLNSALRGVISNAPTNRVTRAACTTCSTPRHDQDDVDRIRRSRLDTTLSIRSTGLTYIPHQTRFTAVDSFFCRASNTFFVVVQASRNILSRVRSTSAELEDALTPNRAPMSQGGPRAPTSLSWILLLMLLRVSGADEAEGPKNAKEVYVYSGPVSKPPMPPSGSFQLLSMSGTTTKRPRPSAEIKTESPESGLIAFPPSEKVEPRPNHGSFIHFPSAGESHTLIASSTSKPNDVDYGATGILGEAVDQNAFGMTHHIISECDGDECCPGPHCTKDLICHHGHDCYYVPHRKNANHHYSTHRPTHYYEGTPTPAPVRDPPKHRPYDAAQNPPTNIKPLRNRKPPPTKTKTSSHYTAKPSLHQGTYRPLPSHHLEVVKPAASNLALKTQKPTALKTGFGTGVIAATLVDEGVSSTHEHRFGTKEHIGHKIKKRTFLKKYMMPLLMAYKMLFIVLVPVMVKTIVMVISASGLTGFFVALFGAAVTFHYYHSKMNASPTSITLSSPPPSTEATKVTKVIKYLPLPPPMMPQMLPLPHPPPQPMPHPPPQPLHPPPSPTYGPVQHPTPPPFPEEPYGGGYHYPNYQWMDKRRSKRRKKNKGSMLPSLTLFR